MNGACGKEGNGAAVAEKRRGYLMRESESKYFESVNARAEQKETKTVALKTRDRVLET